tara:strand:- start:416 stop:568 length:153 start_codon:yes stop_codon:yes gene_type:complete
MEAEGWKNFWQVAFFCASTMFYLTVIYIAARGIGDISGMIRRMLKGEDAT